MLPEYPQRKKVYLKFHDLLQEYNVNPDFDVVKHAVNLERAIFNHTLVLYYKSVFKSSVWDNTFKTLYIHKAVSLFVNLNPKSHIKNTNLLNRVLNGELEVKDLPGLSCIQIFPEKYKEYKLTVDKTVDMKACVEVSDDGIFKCGKCQSYKTSYYQMQTRSADEPLTTFVTCHNCTKKWKMN